MANEQNLIPFKKGETRSKTLGSKGGKSQHPAKSLAKRRWCNMKCPLYPCWAMPMANEQFKGECALKRFPLEFQLATYRLIKEGARGFQQELTNKLAEYVMAAKTGEKLSDAQKFEHAGKVIDKMIAVKDSVYGKKSIVEAQVDVKAEGTISLADLKEAFHRHLKEKSK